MQTTVACLALMATTCLAEEQELNNKFLDASTTSAIVSDVVQSIVGEDKNEKMQEEKEEGDKFEQETNAAESWLDWEVHFGTLLNWFGVDDFVCANPTPLTNFDITKLKGSWF